MDKGRRKNRRKRKKKEIHFSRDLKDLKITEVLGWVKCFTKFQGFFSNFKHFIVCSQGWNDEVVGWWWIEKEQILLTMYEYLYFTYCCPTVSRIASSSITEGLPDLGLSLSLMSISLKYQNQFCATPALTV